MADPNKVGYPTGGITAFALRTATSPSKAQMADPNFEITSIAGWVVLGLRGTDGAPNWAATPATPQESYEEGYKFNPQNGTLVVTQNLIEQNPAVLGLLRGTTYVDGVADIDIDAIVDGKIYTEDKLRTKTGDLLERYMAPVATVTGITTPQKARGTQAANQITITADRADELDGRAHFRHALIAADDTPEPVILGISPAGRSVGDDVLIEGRHFTGATAVSIDGTPATEFAVAGDAAIIATIPVGAAGVAPVIVTTPDGASEPVDYTVV